MECWTFLWKSFRKRRINWKKKIRFKILGKQLLFLKYSILQCKEKFIALRRQYGREIYMGTLKSRWRFSKLTCKFQNSVQISKMSFTCDLGQLVRNSRSHGLVSSVMSTRKYTSSSFNFKSFITVLLLHT